MRQQAALRLRSMRTSLRTLAGGACSTATGRLLTDRVDPGRSKQGVSYAHCACQLASPLLARAALLQACRRLIASSRAAANDASTTLVAHVNAHGRWGRAQHRQRMPPIDSCCSGGSQQRIGYAHYTRTLVGGAYSIATGLLLTNICCLGGGRQRFCHAHCACRRARSLVARAASPTQATHG